MAARLQQQYREQIVPELQKSLGLANPMQVPKVDKVSIACRTHHPRYHDLRDLADESGGRVEVVTEPKELMTRLVRAHFALTSGDAWSLEVCCVGIPQLVLHGDRDETVSMRIATSYATAARNAGDLCELRVLTRTGHF